ncbi:MAG TPA: DUF6069 family protein [Anaerolineales bacterium]|nr:DUF6069 family protein [Anaerolineales bacterium]
MKGPYSLRRLLWAGPLATLAALAANSIYFIITKAFGEQYRIPLDTTGAHVSPMPPLMFILPTGLAGLAASVFFGLLIRFSRLPGVVFLSVAIAAFILSLGGPSSLPNTSLKTELLLSGMNLLTALLLTGGILLLSHRR